MVGLVAPISGTQDAALPVALSLFPLTAPVAMIMRLTGGGVPLWQLLLSAGLVFAAAYATLRATAAMFHAQNLLSGEPFSVNRLAGALLGRMRA
jgi:ABC-2 type transport system permease protein